MLYFLLFSINNNNNNIYNTIYIYIYMRFAYLNIVPASTSVSAIKVCAVKVLLVELFFSYKKLSLEIIIVKFIYLERKLLCCFMRVLNRHH
jgi:hypothetical protein